VNVWNFLADAATKWPERTALRCGREFTYADTQNRAHNVAALLRANGIEPGDRVACLMDNDIDHLLAYFGIAAAGAILVSLNTRLTAGEQRDILAHSGSKLLLHDTGHAARAAELGIATATVADATACEFVATPAATNEPAQLYYTSGTTGSPK
tara:strand:- start:3 stop:464 length:462 start_codon:yes stop_codon:yes gene_type:complete